jgi:hypothetical protein
MMQETDENKNQASQKGAIEKELVCKLASIPTYLKGFPACCKFLIHDSMMLADQSFTFFA